MGTVPQKGAFTVNEFTAWAGIGRTYFYHLVNTNCIKPVKCGTRTLVRYDEAMRWLDSLPEAA